MTLQIDLTPEIENRLQQEAAREGLSPGELARRLIEIGLPEASSRTVSTSPPAKSRTAQLLEQWRAEDATDDPALLEAAERELEEFKANLNANRAATGERPPFK